MKLGEAMDKAAAGRDAKMLGDVCDFCRFALGWTHERFVNTVSSRSGLSAAEVDELLAEADEIASAT